MLCCEEKFRPCKPGGETTISCSSDANKQVDGVEVDFQIVTISNNILPYQVAEEDGQNQGCSIDQTNTCSQILDGKTKRNCLCELRLKF